MKKQKGITLIALVITIIILLILAGIAIGQISGENGLFVRTKEAKIYTRESTAEEIVKLKILEIQANYEGTATIDILLQEMSKEEETEVDVKEVKTQEIGTISCEIPSGKVIGIIVMAYGYEEFDFLIGEDLEIKEICGIEKDKWAGETLENSEINKSAEITIEATPEKREDTIEEEQTIEVKVTSTKEWTDWEGKYAWKIEKEEPQEEDWKSLTLKEGTNKLEKTGEVTETQKERGNYYLWVKIKTSGVSKTKSFGPYKMTEIPTQSNLICYVSNINAEQTQAEVAVGSNKNFEKWKIVYSINEGTETEIEQGKETTIQAMQGDIITVKYKRTGYTDITKELEITELKRRIAITYIHTQVGNTITEYGEPQYIYTFNNEETLTIRNGTPTKSGYRFMGWNTKQDGSGTAYNIGSKITISKDIKLYAQWKEEKTLTITYVLTQVGNTITKFGEPQTVKTINAQETLKIPTAVPEKTGNIFKQWNTKLDGTGTAYNPGDSITISQNINLYAQWEVAYKITRNLGEKIKIDNSITVLEKDHSYTATLTVPNDYILDTFTVTMGENTVTVNKRTGKIEIAKVTGDIIINATARKITVWNISTTGNDTTGDGSEAKPFASIKKAVQSAQNYDKIFIKAGYYEVSTGFTGTYYTALISDNSKILEIYGENEKTIIWFRGGMTTKRDTALIALFNKESIVRNLTLEYTPKRYYL